MCNDTVNMETQDTKQFGFSLLEIALTLVIAGLVIAPGVAWYKHYKIKKDWEKTEEHINSDILFSLRKYRSVYGRYPCPAPRTAVPGDVEYGHDKPNCDTFASGSCVDGVCTANSNLSGKTVAIGSIPFKTLGMYDLESRDSYRNRITYAVTTDMTDPDTFELSGGGISVNDDNGNPIVVPEHTAHFVIISHGPNAAGAFTKNGVVAAPCTNGSVHEQENCDEDALFISTELNEDFDDRISFFADTSISEWEVSEIRPDAIHLKNTDSMALGVSGTANLSDAPVVLAKKMGDHEGTVRANKNIYLEDGICDFDGFITGKCFNPNIIAGELGDTPAEGLKCGPDEYITGIENNSLLCDDEIFISCKEDTFITGIDNGMIECSPVPDDPCVDTEITTFCGDTKTIDGTYSGGLSFAYSGQCEMLTERSTAFFDAQIAGMSTTSEVETFIINLNKESRNSEACGDAVDNSLVRDTFQCYDGEFRDEDGDINEPFVSQEKLYRHSNFHGNPKYKNAPWPAENYYSGDDRNINNAYNPGNNNNYHDCWCREDYRLDLESCDDPLATGNKIVIDKYICPSTSESGHTNWEEVYSTDAFCGCSDYVKNETVTCNSYYDEVNGTTGTTGLSGNVVKKYNVTCVGGVPQQDSTPFDVVGEETCSCVEPDEDPTYTACPDGHTNSWTWEGETQTNIEKITVAEYSCPGTKSNGIYDPPVYLGITEHTGPTCVCTETTAIERKDCAADETGAGVYYKKEWDCSIDNGDGTFGAWEPESDWEVYDDQCYPCAWKASTLQENDADNPAGNADGPAELGSTDCDCGDTSPKCWEDGSIDGKYDIWGPCICGGELD